MHGLVCTGNTFEQVRRLTLFVLTIAATVQDDDVEDVAPKAEDCDNQHEPAIDFTRVNQAFSSLDQKPHQEAPNNDNTSEGSEDVGPVISIGVLESCRLSCQVEGNERDHEAHHVTELMGGVTQDSQRSRNSSASGFHQAEYKTDDGYEYEFIAGASSLESLIFEMFTVLKRTPMIERKILVRDWVLKLLFRARGA